MLNLVETETQTIVYTDKCVEIVQIIWNFGSKSHTHTTKSSVYNANGGILTFMSRIKFSLICVEQEKTCYNLSASAFYPLSRLVGKPTMWFPNRSDTNRPVQAQKRARRLKFRI